ncbi:hypothetical protein LAZ67_5003595 [Cordylochernes scorpioides]|uniref:CCHC-type domain-containing protein n=1 Tax=Cordylochernes scorpioides TaxID=51811 RepID=A0ABY6KHC9_9ARAC|nr:hypothetical protein LAZ67_5003595 [Cordylochernes scorpioides]
MLKAVRAAHTLPQGVWASLRTKGKLVLHSSNPDTIPAVTTSLANKLDGMKIRQQKEILPRICLFKVDEETSNSTIEETFLETPAVKQLPGDKVVCVAHRSGPRNGTCTAFIEVELKTFRALGIRGRIVVDGVILNFEKSIRARVCFRCCGFGHNSAQCTRAPKCFHCGEDGHEGRACPSIADQRTSKCANCCAKGLPTSTSTHVVQAMIIMQLSILQCNINGLCSTATKIKLEEIMEIAEKQKIQIIALQETKLNEKYNLKFKNYNILRKDRNKEGGGLAFLIKNLYYEDIAINIPNTSDLEAQGIKVYLNQNKTINIFNMYHPPNNKLIDDGTMAQFLTDNTIIVGDLNAKHQLWGCSTPNPRGKILSNLFDDNAFMCLNDGNPTHHSYSYNTAQALDISFSSPDIFHKCKWQILKSIGSDHLPILIEISTKTKTSSIKEKFWNFKKANWNLYQQNTNEDFRKAPTRIKDLEQNWISFKNTIIKAAKVSIPRGNIKKWIPNYTHQAKDIQILINKRNELQKKCTQNQTNCRTELNIVNAKIKRLYVNMKREKWKQTCENLNPRNPNTKLWHLAKQIDRAQPQTENTNMIKNTDGTPATNDKNAANLLGNSYQISSKIKFEIKDKKVEKKARKIIHDCKNVTSTHNIFHEKINMKELDYALENTDLNKTPGPDGIHGQMISNLGKNGKEKLLDIFNNSWKTGKLPQDWKTATIIPIKKLDKSADDPKNYRPISLTSICCKLMEKIILRRLTYHLDTRNLLPKEQYGFRKGHGTIDQLLFFTQKSKDTSDNDWSSGPDVVYGRIPSCGVDSGICHHAVHLQPLLAVLEHRSRLEEVLHHVYEPGLLQRGGGREGEVGGGEGRSWTTAVS